MGRLKSYLSDSEIIQEQQKAEAELVRMPNRYLKRLIRYCDLTMQGIRINYDQPEVAANDTVRGLVQGRLTALRLLRDVATAAVDGEYKSVLELRAEYEGETIFPDDHDYDEDE